MHNTQARTARPARHADGRPAGMAPHMKEAALAEMELGTVCAMHAFQRWIVRCMEAAAMKDLTVVDVLVLHHVNHRTHDRHLADICFVLNIEDAHVVGYSLRKLIGLGVVSADRHGKEVTYSATAPGQAHLALYREIRERRLVDALKTLSLDKSALGELAQHLRRMSGLYDQAARAAASL